MGPWLLGLGSWWRAASADSCPAAPGQVPGVVQSPVELGGAGVGAGTEAPLGSHIGATALACGETRIAATAQRRDSHRQDLGERPRIRAGPTVISGSGAGSLAQGFWMGAQKGTPSEPDTQQVHSGVAHSE